MEILQSHSNEILISSKLAKKLEVSTGQEATFIGSTMDNAFTTYNFNISGVFNLNKGQTDKQMILLDISGAQEALDMQGAATEILGFTNDLFYNDNSAIEIRSNFNRTNNDSSDIYSPIMIALRDTNQMGTMVDFSNAALAVIGGIFLGDCHDSSLEYGTNEWIKALWRNWFTTCYGRIKRTSL